MNFRRTSLLLAAAVLLNACAAVGPRVADTASVNDQLKIIEAGIEKNAQLRREREALSEALSEALAASGDGTAVEEERFDLSVTAVPARTFYRGLVRGTPYNLVVHPDVEGSISLDLKEISVPEVLKVVRDVYGYDFVLEDRLIRVYPDALRTELFAVDYLNVSRSGRSEVQVSAGSVADVAGGNMGQMNNVGGMGMNFSGVMRGGVPGGRANFGNASLLGTVVNTDGEADFWKEVETTLTSIVAGDEGSNVVVTPQVGLAVVRARPESLAAVRSYLQRVQSTLHRQVILEAKILEVTLREGFQAGINWNTFGEDAQGFFEPTFIENPDGTFTLTPGSDKDLAGELLSGTFDGFNPLGTTFTLNAKFSDFEAAIDLLSNQGSVQVLSSPRISTVNNQKAVIKVGGDEFFVTNIATDTITAGGSINTLNSPQLTPFFSGIALDVTPQISDAGDVILHVHPTVSEVKEQRKDISGQLVPLASSTIRESDSIVRARDGQIIVIGGLMQNSSNDDNAGVPLLKRLPGIGHLFQQQARSSIKSELVILLRPVVVDDAKQEAELKSTAERMAALRALMDRAG